MDRSWLDSYPQGIAADIDAGAYASLCHLLQESCERHAQRTAFSCLGGTLSYAGLDAATRQLAAAFQQDLGLAPGERIAIMLPNLLQYPVVLFAAFRAGLVVVNVNPLYTPDELAFQLADSGAAAIVVLENFAHTVERALARSKVRSVVVTRVGDLLPFARRTLVNFAVRHVKRAVRTWKIERAIDLRSLLQSGRDRVLHPVDHRPENIAFLQYTGGTTGRAKGAVLTHRNMVANVEQLAAWVAPVLAPASETVITALPLYHIFALTTNLLLFVKLGGCNVLIPDGRDIGGLTRTLASTRFTAITGVNTLYKALLDTPQFAAVPAANAGALKLAVAGGMALVRPVAERWQQMTGIPLVEGYGLTEASPVVCANRVDAPAFTGKLGLPLPSTHVRIEREGGGVADIDEAGEICVCGPQVMRGYWNAPEETAQAFTADGWLRTGDVGRMDARGYVEFVERLKDVIVVSGFKAYPTEIEAVVLRHPGVKDASAVGVPDARSGEAIALFVVRSDPALTAQSVLEHCAQHLTFYKRPRFVEFRDALPKTPVGKTLRRALSRDDA